MDAKEEAKELLNKYSNMIYGLDFCKMKSTPNCSKLVLRAALLAINERIKEGQLMKDKLKENMFLINRMIHLRKVKHEIEQN